MKVATRRKGKRERSIRITFDEFLLPAVAAWKDLKPYAQIVCDIPKSQTNIITSYIPIPQKHPSLWVFIRQHYSDSDCEVDIEGDDYESRKELEILQFLGYPSVPLKQS